jgi:hypothetical protein
MKRTDLIPIKIQKAITATNAFETTIENTGYQDNIFGTGGELGGGEGWWGKCWPANFVIHGAAMVVGLRPHSPRPTLPYPSSASCTTPPHQHPHPSAPASAGGTDRDLAVPQFTQNCGAYNIRVLNIVNLKLYNIL